MAETPFDKTMHKIEQSEHERGESPLRAKEIAKATAGKIAREKGKAPGEKGFAAAHRKDEKIKEEK